MGEPSRNLLTQTADPGIAPARGVRRKRSPKGGRLGPAGDRGPALRKSRVGCLIGLEGDHGSGEPEVQSEAESPVLAVPSSRNPHGTPGGEGRGRRKRASRESLTEADGARRPFVCGRGAGALGPVAPAQSRASFSRLPDSRDRSLARPPPCCPRRGSASSPAPSLARGPHLLRWGAGGGAREPQGTNCTGDQPSGTQTKRQSHLSSLAPLPPTWSLVPGQPGPPAGHLLSRAPVALEAGPQSCRVGGPLKALSQRKGWRELELSLNSGRSLVFSPSQPSLQ